MIKNNKVEVKIEECTNCNMCALVCPYSLYIAGEKAIHLSEIFEESCIECGHCVAICPVNIITLNCHPDGKFKELPKKEALASFENLYYLAISRRSIRHFKKQVIPKELLKKIFELARYTATGHNEENIYYTIIQDRDTLEKYSDEITKNIKNFVEKFETPEGYESLKRVMPEKIFMRASESVKGFKRKINDIAAGKEVWHWDAPLILIHSPKSAATLVENCSLAAANIMLAAETLSLATCSLGYATNLTNQFKTVAKIAKLPRNHVVGYALAIGYPKIKYQRIPARKSAKITWL